MKTGTYKYDDTMTEEQLFFEHTLSNYISKCLSNTSDEYYLYGVNWYELPVVQKRLNAYGLGIRATRLLGGSYRVKCLKKK